MELKRDLLVVQKKSVFRIIMGILFFVISIVWVIDLVINSKTSRPFDWLFFGVFVMNGLIHSIEGFGFSLARLFGKAFILIDTDRIAIKTGVLAKEQSVYWKDIKSLSYKPIRFKIVRNDNTSMTFNLSKLDYLLIKDMKISINEIANEKGLEVT
jgi:hypothetical protein